MSRSTTLTSLACALAVISGCRTEAIRDQHQPRPRSARQDTRKAPPQRPETPLRGLIVYSKLVSEEEYTYDGGRYDLYTMSIPGGKITRLTNHHADARLKLGGAIRDPLFSPDGQRIAFRADYSTSDPDSRRITTGAAPNGDAWLNIWVVDLGSHKVTPLTTGDSGWMNTSWSPSSRFLAAVQQIGFSMLDSGPKGTFGLYAWDLRAHKGHRLIHEKEGFSQVTWSRDGSRVIYQGWDKPGLFSISPCGGRPTRLMGGKPERFGFALSPSSSRIAFVQGDRVYIGTRDGSKATPAMKVETAEQWRQSPILAWSADGKRLAAVSAVLDENRASTESRVHIYDTSTGRNKVIAAIPYEVTEVYWSHDGRWLICRLHGSMDVDSPTRYYAAFGGDGLAAISLADGKSVILKQADEDTKGLDWFELP